MHDQTAVTTEGIKELLRDYPTVMARVDTGYRGLAKAFPDRVCAPPPKPPKDAPAEQIAAYKQATPGSRPGGSVSEHAIAGHKQWRPLQRYIGRREAYAQTHLAIAGLVSDRAAAEWATRTRQAKHTPTSIEHQAVSRFLAGAGRESPR